MLLEQKLQNKTCIKNMRDKKSFITSPKADQKVQIGLKTKEFVTVVLFSENHGHRMKSYGPISLIKVGSKTLIEKQIEAIKSSFVNFEIIVCCGFETSKIVSFIKNKYSNINIRVVENQMHYNSNCCESARLCLSNTLNNKVIFCNGGILISSAHLALIELDKNCILTQSESYDSNFEIGVIENNNKLENFSIGVKNKYWSEILYLTGEKEINSFYSVVSNPEYKNKFMFEAINEINKNTNIQIIKTHKPLTKLDNIKTLKRISL